MEDEMKKNVENSVDLKAEITHLKRQVAGLKGHITNLTNTKNDLDKCVSELLDERERNGHIINGLRSELGEARDSIHSLKQKIASFNRLPWYKKAFNEV